MKRFLLKAFFFILLIAVIAQGITLGWLIFERQTNIEKWARYEKSKLEKLNFVENVNVNPEEDDKEQYDFIQKSPIDQENMLITGWIPDWDFEDGFATLKQYKDLFGSVSPFWFDANSDGTLKTNTSTNNPEFIAFTKENNIDLIPTITCFDSAVLNSILTNEENLERHITEIVKFVTENNYDGIDLDYESTYLKDKSKFLEFMKDLGAELYKNDKKFVFTVMPKWGQNSMVYTTLPETRKVQDYKILADIVDEIRIMTYDYTGRNNEFYGPNAPIDWLEDTIKYALWVGVPRENLVLGVPTYSYDYSKREKMPTLDYYPAWNPTSSETLPDGFAYYNTTVDEIIKDYQTVIKFEEDWGEALLEYTFEGEERVVVYPNSESIDLRKKLAADYGIRGVAFWRIGDEGTLELD